MNKRHGSDKMELEKVGINKLKVLMLYISVVGYIDRRGARPSHLLIKKRPACIAFFTQGKPSTLFFYIVNPPPSSHGIWTNAKSFILQPGFLKGVVYCQEKGKQAHGACAEQNAVDLPESLRITPC
jgi:hypothetical protein